MKARERWKRRTFSQLVLYDIKVQVTAAVAAIAEMLQTQVATVAVMELHHHTLLADPLFLEEKLKKRKRRGSGSGRQTQIWYQRQALRGK